MLWVASAGVAVVLQYQRPKTLLWRSQCYRKQCVISQFVALRVKVKREIKGRVAIAGSLEELLVIKVH